MILGKVLRQFCLEHQWIDAYWYKSCVLFSTWMAKVKLCQDIRTDNTFLSLKQIILFSATTY